MRIEVDLFSGRPNPELEVDDARAGEIIAELSRNRELLTEDAPAQLGYRGLILRRDGAGLLEGVSPGLSRFDSPAGGSRSVSREVALRLVEMAEPVRALEKTTPFEQSGSDEKRFLLEQIAAEGSAAPGMLVEDGSKALRVPEFRAPMKILDCGMETLNYDPGYWNAPRHIRRNNCYAFATNRRTDTFPQPGLASGSMLGELTCEEVSKGALGDGAHWDGECFDESEIPRLYVALVIWPGRDYHWYRMQEGEFWAHKPGGTPAVDVDGDGKRIDDPQACDRGPYTQFCGYMLIPNSIQVA